jgi:Ca2+-binding RTX toxin-like protein
MLYGEAGRDVLTGDTGADRFVYMTLTDSPVAVGLRDQIRDFSHAQGDRIDLSAIDAITGGANNAFTFIGAGAFTGMAGQIHADAYGSNWSVEATSTATSWPISWSR